jgi:cell division protein FtsB
LRLTIVARRILFLIAFILIAAYGYVALQGPQGIPALQDKRREIRKLEEDNASLQSEIQYRRDRIKKLEQNPAEQELEVRKNLKLLRPGETSFILPDRPQQNQATPDRAKPPDPSAPPAAH